MAHLWKINYLLFIRVPYGNRCVCKICYSYVFLLQPWGTVGQAALPVLWLAKVIFSEGGCILFYRTFLAEKNSKELSIRLFYLLYL